MASEQDPSRIVYSGTYSNVPVYELRMGANIVMRRRSDNYINATHILKTADLDKPARTRVLEKEVQLGTHEKVQGGYGKYQGTWIPLDSGVDLAKKYSVFHVLQPLFEFAPGSQSPPPAPKHVVSNSNRNKTSKNAAAAAATAAANNARHQLESAQMESQARPSLQTEPSYEYENHGLMPHEEESYDNTTIASQSFVEEDDYQAGDHSRKRKRGREETSTYSLWADSLLDYYVVAGTDASHSQEYAPPPPPEGMDVNTPIDNQGHTALHWAASMGDTEYVKDLLKVGADIYCGNIRGETALVKCSVFANCFDRGTYRKMLELLGPSLTTPDKFGATVLHHIAKSALANAKGNRACHYLDVALDLLSQQMDRSAFYQFVNERDQFGDTAFHIVVRASRRCTRLFQSRGIPADVPNKSGETVEGMLRDKAARRAASVRVRPNGTNIIPSSSPIAPSSPVLMEGAGSPPSRSRFGDGPLVSSSMTTRSSQSFNKSMTNFYTTAVNNFMQAGEDELQIKELLLADLKNHLSRTNKKMIDTQHECELLEAEPVGDVANLSSEYARLARDAEAYSEQMQHRFLHQAIRDGENKARADYDQTHGSGNDRDRPIDDKELSERIHFARLLQAEQEQRKILTAKLVEAQAQAGMGETGEMGIRVLMKTLDVSRDKLVQVIPEMLENMEMNLRYPVIAARDMV